MDHEGSSRLGVPRDDEPPQLSRRGVIPRAPGVPQRVHDPQPPVAPPRPSNTISPWTRDIITPSTPAPAPSGPGRGVRTAPGGMSPRRSTRLTVALPVAAAQPSTSSISLTSPRPGQDRNQNLYVDAPLRPAVTSTSTSGPGRSQAAPVHHLPQSKVTDSFSPVIAPTSSPSPLLTLEKKKAWSNPKKHLSDSSSLASFSLNTTDSDCLDPTNVNEDSIICRECGKCKCVACRSPSKLRDKWICGNMCQLSDVVDGVTCMCVVKACLYHYGKDKEENHQSKSGFDSPCSCSAEHCLGRWACLGLASVFLPCLFCYLPLMGCLKGWQAVHQRLTSTGCRCNKAKATTSSANVSIIDSQPSSLSTTIISDSSDTENSGKDHHQQQQQPSEKKLRGAEKRLLG